jgi:predicted RNase H-like HicB family nuclease
MKMAYPVILAETDDKVIPYIVYVPDFDVQTQGKDLVDAIYMAGDIISLTGTMYEDEGKDIPTPSKPGDVNPASSPFHNGDDAGILSETVTLVPVDFDFYRRKRSSISVRRNVSLPSWLDAEAEQAGVNVSAILQEALKAKLGVEA